MPELTATLEIRARLEVDRLWALYALGDLTPEHREYSRWFGTPDGAVALLYGAFAVPVFFVMGALASVAALLTEMGPPEMFVLVRPDIVPVVAERYTLRSVFAMWRMILDPVCAPSAPLAPASRLTLADLPALTRLYADDERVDSDPRFFTSAMLESGVYYGVYEEAELVAVAGTHLVAPAEGLAAVGNVYTRRDRRRRGLATQTVGAVVAQLQRLELRTIGLNVAQSNASAIRLYERLGFIRYCPYIEAHAIEAHTTKTIAADL